uniref:DUF1618 domain-containing protein n=1 Tax=Setaria viridis TaxID=4556 RepID=A0A4U6TRR8_SETVI|nr:hypothetical protein SEVIR_7G179600v2 [Setaria viridis]
METPWVLLRLHRTVHFINGTGAAATAIGGVPSPEEAMSAMKPAVAIAEPPEVTYLSMLRQTPAENMGGVHGGEISSTDEGLAVLYTGSYRPGNRGFSGSGCYLVYDASSSSVSAVPPLPPDHSPGLPAMDGLGRSAAILRHRGGGEDAYVLAELVTTHDRVLPDANSTCGGRRRRRAPRTPPASGPRRRCASLSLPSSICGPTYSFEVDMAFPLAGSRVCWVDLFAGVLVCDLLAPEGPEFSFVPLPECCCVDIPIRSPLRASPRHGAKEGPVLHKELHR